MQDRVCDPDHPCPAVQLDMSSLMTGCNYMYIPVKCNARLNGFIARDMV